MPEQLRTWHCAECPATGREPASVAVFSLIDHYDRAHPDRPELAADARERVAAA